MGWRSIRRGREEPKGKEGKMKGKGRKEKEERKEREGEENERERGRQGNRCFNGRNSSDQEVKFVYSMGAMLQEVGIISTLVYFQP